MKIYVEKGLNIQSNKNGKRYFFYISSKKYKETYARYLSVSNCAKDIFVKLFLKGGKAPVFSAGTLFCEIYSITAIISLALTIKWSMPSILIWVPAYLSWITFCPVETLIFSLSSPTAITVAFCVFS